MIAARKSLLAKAVALAVAVYLLGPILTAVVRAEIRTLWPPYNTPGLSRGLVSGRLVRLYEDENFIGGERLFFPEFDKACGYDNVTRLLAKVPNVRSPEGKSKSSFAQRGDFFILWAADDLARSHLRQKRAFGLQKALGDFGLWFMADCIDGTILATVCNARLTRLIERIDREPMSAEDYPGADVWAKARCTYLDGVAARLGLPIAKRDGPM